MFCYVHCTVTVLYHFSHLLCVRPIKYLQLRFVSLALNISAFIFVCLHCIVVICTNTELIVNY